MNAKFEEWWTAYLKSSECKLKQTAWSYNEVGIIKKAMKDAFLHTKPVDSAAEAKQGG